MKALLNSIDRILARLWQRILASSSVDLSSLVVLRLLVGPFMLLLSAPFFSWINHAPEGLFEPPILSFAYLFESFPAPWIFTTWDIIVVLLAACVSFGIRTRWACIILVIGNVSAASFAYSFGKIDHDIMYKLVLACLAFTNWGTQSALIPDRPVTKRTHNAALGILAILIAFGMFTAGLEKAYVWLDFNPTTNGFFSWFYSGYFSLGRQYLLAPTVLTLPPQLFELADYGAVAFETSGLIFLLLGKRWWQLWLTVACLFHLLNTLLLNIGFVEHSFVYGVFLLPLVWSPKNFAKNEKLPIFFGTTALVFAAIHIVQRISGSGSEYFFLVDPQAARMANLYGSLVIWGLMVPSVAFAWLTKRNQDVNPDPEADLINR